MCLTTPITNLSHPLRVLPAWLVPIAPEPSSLFPLSFSGPVIRNWANCKILKKFIFILKRPTFWKEERFAVLKVVKMVNMMNMAMSSLVDDLKDLIKGIKPPKESILIPHPIGCGIPAPSYLPILLNKALEMLYSCK